MRKNCTEDYVSWPFPLWRIPSVSARARGERGRDKRMSAPGRRIESEGETETLPLAGGLARIERWPSLVGPTMKGNPSRGLCLVGSRLASSLSPGDEWTGRSPPWQEEIYVCPLPEEG